MTILFERMKVKIETIFQLNRAYPHTFVINIQLHRVKELQLTFKINFTKR